VPWATGKSPVTKQFAAFLAFWARKLSWTDTAKSFRVSWDIVADAVTWVVEWGLANRNIENVTAIGVDEIQYRGGHNYLTLVYQIDKHCRLCFGSARIEKRKHCMHSVTFWVRNAVRPLNLSVLICGGPI